MGKENRTPLVYPPVNTGIGKSFVTSHKVNNPDSFISGVLALVNNLYYKLPKGTSLIGYATDVLTANGFNYTLKLNKKKNEFELIKIK